MFRIDSEINNLMDDLRQERNQREKFARDKEIAVTEKHSIEQNLNVSF